MPQFRAMLQRLVPSRFRAEGGPWSLRRRKISEALVRLQERLGYAIRHEAFFRQALSHRSSFQRTSDAAYSNERLEFLGDSILNLVVGEYLYHHFPKAEEGELTKFRARLVNRKALAAYAQQIGLAEFISMSASAANAQGKGMDTITADTFEAVIAAIYLDGGFPAARQFVEAQITSAMEHGAVATVDENYKSMLLEFAKASGLGIPRYAVIKEEGPDHDRTFTVQVTINNSSRGVGTGKNKKEAEQAAASQAIGQLL
jgi:ribonuclease-3